MSNRAFYNPRNDLVNVPKLSQYKKSEQYYCTLFHELVHSTGHESRLKREEITKNIIRFGDLDYSKEELVAEIGAAFLCGHGHIELPIIDNSAAYISGWLRKLKNDKKFIFDAAAKAQKAVNYILGEIK